LIISPADGVVQAIAPAPPPPEIGAGDAPRTRISIFMNVFDVHVNRAPVAARVAQLAYRPGKFFNASLDKASDFNERQAIRLAMSDGLELIVVQIAGLIARRIVCHLAPEQELSAGERFGLIRFGSRLDVYLPDGVAPLACVGQRTVAGETVLADIRAQEAQRKGEAS
jgi:phosphatidylserine decarboxylase